VPSALFINDLSNLFFQSIFPAQMIKRGSTPMQKIYTRSGDHGKTAQIQGVRVSKKEPIISFYGAIDEAVSWLGLARVSNTSATLDSQLQQLQRQLFSAGPAALPPYPADLFSESDTRLLEEQIDAVEKQLPPLKDFILPGDTPLAAHLHLSRTAVRKVERCFTRLSEPNPNLQAWINRLSDLLFVLARQASISKEG
jgi:cob(I)alamin adenosyltransferase